MQTTKQGVNSKKNTENVIISKIRKINLCENNMNADREREFEAVKAIESSFRLLCVYSPMPVTGKEVENTL